MMNILALSLVLTSLVSGALIWSPPPPPGHDDHSEVIVKEGHRAAVVEYEKEADGHTKVLISPHDDSSGVDFKDTSNVPGEKKQQAGDEAEGKSSCSRELVCDAFGKCKHKISQALGKTKEMVSETAHAISDKAHDMEEQAARGAKDTVHGYEERAKEAVNEVYEKVKNLGVDKERLSEIVSDIVKCAEEKVTGHTVRECLGKVKESVVQAIGKPKQVAGDVVGTIKDNVVKVKDFDVVDSPKRIGEDIQRNVSGKVEGAEHLMGKAKETAENVRKAGKKGLGEILSKVKQVTNDVIWYIVSHDNVDAVVGLIHMLAFSTACGMCVWVTFVSSYVFGRYLPRQQFEMVQSRIYPVYLKAMAYSVSAVLLGHVASQKKQILSSLGELSQGLTLLYVLLMVLTNMIWLNPRATKLMYKRMKIEKEEGRGITGATKDGIADQGGPKVARPPANIAAERQDVLRLNEKLKRLNTYSSAFNVLTLVGLTWHMAYMAQRLQATR